MFLSKGIVTMLAKRTNPEWSKYLSLLQKIQRPNITDEIINHLICRLCSIIHQDLLVSQNIIAHKRDKEEIAPSMKPGLARSSIYILVDPEDNIQSSGITTGFVWTVDYLLRSMEIGK